MTDFAKEIKEHMPVVANDGVQIGSVDHLDGENSVKLTRDESGSHHWIPVSWVTDVTDTTVMLARSSSQVTEEWSDSSPEDL